MTTAALDRPFDPMSQFSGVAGDVRNPYPGFHQKRIETPVDVARVGELLGERFERLPPVLARTEFCIELGRYLVGQAGIYVTRIVDRKISHGEVFLVTDGGLHHQLAASGNFGTVVRRNYPVAIATRIDQPVEEEASVVGCLCTPLDRLADKAGFPRAEVGDLVARLAATLEPGDHVLVMSNGGFGGLHGRLLEALAARATTARSGTGT